MILFNKISLTLVNPRKGHIYYRGKNIYNKRLDWTGLRKKVGLVFQYPETQLFKPTVIQDTMYGPLNMGLSEDQARERAQDSLSLVGLDKELFLANPSELSGGQKRCVAIAGVLAMQPEVLVLDEPTAGLDPQTVSRIFQVLQAIHRQNNCAILFVSHRMDEIEQYAKTMWVLHEGRISMEGPPREIFKQYEWKNNFWQVYSLRCLYPLARSGNKAPFDFFNHYLAVC